MASICSDNQAARRHMAKAREDWKQASDFDIPFEDVGPVLGSLLIPAKAFHFVIEGASAGVQFAQACTRSAEGQDPTPPLPAPRTPSGVRLRGAE